MSGYDGDLDDLRDLLTVARETRAEAWRETGTWIRANGDDPEMLRRIDRCLILDSNVRSLERQIKRRVAG